MGQRFHILLASLLAMHLVLPFISGRTLGLIVYYAILWANLIFGVRAVASSRRAVGVVVGLGALSFLLSLYSAYRESSGESTSGELHVSAVIVVTGLFFGALTTELLRFVLRPGRIDSSRIAAAACAYFLLAAVWAFAYALLENLGLGSISGMEGLDARERYSHLLYFSFTTLTTLGYGDLTPVSGPTRALATTQAVVGQLFLAVLVARLVALQILHSSSDPPGGGPRQDG